MILSKKIEIKINSADKNKIKETNLEKYGVEYSSQNENSRKKYKETCLEKYGVDNASKSDEIKNKKIQTSLKNYGVPYPSQNLLVYMKQQKSGFKMKFHEDIKLFYRGSYEKDFLDFCFLNKINISEGKRISYIFEKKSHYYFSDFYFEELNLIIEIKSHYTYNKYIKKNKAKKKYTLKNGYNYLIIFDKNYTQFINQIFPLPISDL